MSKTKWLTSPLLTFLSIISGLLIGLYNKPLAEILSPFGQLYLALMSMCILPIILAAIVSSVGKSLHTNHISDMIKRLCVILIGGLLIASMFGAALGTLTQPGTQLSGAGKELLSNKVADLKGNNNGEERSGFVDFLLQVIPSNIFHALSQGNNLAVVFFALLLGISLGKITADSSKKTLEAIHILYTALLKIVTWIMYLLPIGLCFLFAGYASKISINEVTALAKLLGVIYAAAIILVIFCSLLIWRKSQVSYLKSVSALKTPLLIAFGSSSSFAAIPAMIHSLEQRLHLERGIAELIIPLGVNLFRPGTVLRFVISALFIAQLYGQSLVGAQLAILIFAAILASLAVSGMPGIASASIFAFVLAPLGLPSTVGIILFITILPITDPIITLLNVKSNCAVAMLMKPRSPLLTAAP